MRGSRQRRDGHPWRPRHLRRPIELPAVGLSDGPGRHHGRRRQHPDADADHVRARRAAHRIPISTRRVAGGAGSPTGSAVSMRSRTPSTITSRSRFPMPTGALFHNLTGGVFASSPPERAAHAALVAPACPRQHAPSRFVADLTVALLGGGLKAKQKITGRMADALSELYHALRHVEALRGRRPSGRR